MSTELSVPDSGSKKRLAVRPWFVAAVLVVAAIIAWATWPSDEGIDPYELSRTDGRARFYATSYPKVQPALGPGVTVPQRIAWEWWQLKRRFSKPNPSAFSFPASQVQPCSITGLLNQCMWVTGTKYLVAVEIGSTVEFGNSNTLSGAQWVVAVEHAIGSSNLVVCYDYGTKRNFQDTLLVIRDRPGVVKVIPRTKLADYQKAGLVRAGSR
jgi:hypothetical protein